MTVLLYIHVIAATVWVGGLIVLAGLVPAVRRATDDGEVIRVMARRFGVISWTALGLLIVTGTWMVMIAFNLSGVLVTKIALVLVSAGLAAWHTAAAGSQSPRLRGMIQGAILTLGLVIVGLALEI